MPVRATHRVWIAKVVHVLLDKRRLAIFILGRRCIVDTGNNVCSCLDVKVVKCDLMSAIHLIDALFGMTCAVQ